MKLSLVAIILIVITFFHCNVMYYYILNDYSYINMYKICITTVHNCR